MVLDGPVVFRASVQVANPFFVNAALFGSKLSGRRVRIPTPSLVK
jgi:hypothetical protein